MPWDADLRQRVYGIALQRYLLDERAFELVMGARYVRNREVHMPSVSLEDARRALQTLVDDNADMVADGTSRAALATAIETAENPSTQSPVRAPGRSRRGTPLG